MLQSTAKESIHFWWISHFNCSDVLLVLPLMALIVFAVATKHTILAVHLHLLNALMLQHPLGLELLLLPRYLLELQQAFDLVDAAYTTRTNL